MLGSGNQPPNGTILQPTSDVTIAPGGSVTFSGSGTDPDGNTPLTYQWTFGTGGPATSTNQNPGVVTFPNAGTYVVNFTVTDSLGAADPTPATRTVIVQSASSGVIPQAGWTVRYVDSQETVGESAPATNAFDGNTSTFWHTQWLNAQPGMPHELQIDLGSTYSVSGFRYLPRQGVDNGRIAQYEFYVSTDGTTWGPAVATGTWPNTSAEQQVLFTSKTGRYVRLRALTEVLGRYFTTVAELNVLGSGNQPPDSTILQPTSDVTIAPGGSVTFNGSGTDPDGNTPLTYRWTFGTGGPATSTSQNPGPVTFPNAGTYLVTFTVTDSLGVADPTPATRTVTVQSISNQPPNGTILQPTSDVTIAPGGSVTFSGSGTDPDGNTPLTYRWTFGAGGPATSTSQNPGPVTFPNAGTYVVNFTVTDSLGAPDPTPATRTVIVQSVSSGVIPQTGWTVRYVDSQETVGESAPATNAFDGNASTFWHTQWFNAQPGMPHELQIDLGSTYSVSGFRYLPRQGMDNGRIAQYQFYVSTDGTTWGPAVATGTWPNTATEQQVLFTAKTGRYVRLRALTEVLGGTSRRWRS